MHWRKAQGGNVIGYRDHHFRDRIPAVGRDDVRLRHNPQNWATTYPGSAHIGRLPELPLKAGDTWVQAGPANPAKIGAYHEAVARELTRSAD